MKIDIEKEKDKNKDIKHKSPLEENKKDVVAKINCKIHFLWSFREFYHNLMIKSEKKINHFNETIQKSNKIIESLNGKSFF